MTQVAPASVVWNNGAAMPDSGVESPAYDAMRKYGKALFSVPGVVALSWKGGEEAKELTLRYRSPMYHAMGNAMLEKSIEGVDLLGTIWRGPEKPEPLPVVAVGDVVRGVSGVRGVWDYKYAQTSPYQNGRVTFRTIDKATTELLDPIIKNRLDFGETPRGTKRYMNVSWRSGVPQR